MEAQSRTERTSSKDAESNNVMLEILGAAAAEAEAAAAAEFVLSLKYAVGREGFTGRVGADSTLMKIMWLM
jgi:hypothetical protein